MKNTKLFSKGTLSAIAGLTLVTVVIGYGCGPAMQVEKSFIAGSNDNSSLGGGETVGGGNDANNGAVVAGAKTTQVLFYKQACESYKSMTGVTPSNVTNALCASELGTLSSDGQAGSINAPANYSMTKIAAEFCRDVRTAEKALAAANRRYFNQINFAGTPAANADAARADALARMARNFWGRNIASEESAALLAGLTAANFANTAAGTDQLALYACTAMLSSLDASRF